MCEEEFGGGVGRGGLRRGRRGGRRGGMGGGRKKKERLYELGFFVPVFFWEGKEGRTITRPKKNPQPSSFWNLNPLFPLFFFFFFWHNNSSGILAGAPIISSSTTGDACFFWLVLLRGGEGREGEWENGGEGGGVHTFYFSLICILDRFFRFFF